MTRRERRGLLAGAVALAVVCSALFARAVLARRAADAFRSQARAALVAAPTSPATDAAQRATLRWSGASRQMRYWQELQRFRIVTGEARRAARYTLLPLPLVFRLEASAASLRNAAAADGSRPRRSRLEEMLGLAYYYDAVLHRGEVPAAPQLEGKAAAAFRRAVLLDGANDAAKTDLEWLLQKEQQRRSGRAQPGRPVPGQTRAQNAMQDASGHPAQNGSVGRRIVGGY